MLNEQIKLDSSSKTISQEDLKEKEEILNFILLKTIFISSILIIILHLLSSFESFSRVFIFDNPMDSLFYYTLIIEVIAFIYFGWRAKRILGKGYKERARIGLIGGLILGFILAIFELIWYHKLWTVFNLITEPVMTGIIGFLMSGLIGEMRRRKDEG